MSFIKTIAGKINNTEAKEVRIDSSTHSLQTLSYEHHEIHSGSHYYIEDVMTLAASATADFCVTTPDSGKEIHLLFAFDADFKTTVEGYEGSVFAADGALVTQRNNNRVYSWIGSHASLASSSLLADPNAAFTVDALIGYKVYNETDGSYGIITDNDATTATTTLIGGTGNNFENGDLYEINNSQLIVESGSTITSLGRRILAISSGTATNPTRGEPGGHSRSDELVLKRNTKYVFRFTSGVNDNAISYKATWYEHTRKD